MFFNDFFWYVAGSDLILSLPLCSLSCRQRHDESEIMSNTIIWMPRVLLDGLEKSIKEKERVIARYKKRMQRDRKRKEKGKGNKDVLLHNVLLQGIQKPLTCLSSFSFYLVVIVV
jgi:hypothetical protein